MRIQAIAGLALLTTLGTGTIAADPLHVDRFTFVRPPAPESTVDPKGRLSVDLDRWSTDSEREQMLATLSASGGEKLMDALRDVPRIGTLHWPGGLEYTVLYARSNPRPDGGHDVVLVVDRPLWMWWESTPPSTSYSYTLLQMRLDRNGSGEGRLSFGVPVTQDKTLGAVLSDYAKAPAVLVDVRRERDAT